MRPKETRVIPADQLELRVAGDGEEKAIAGYVAVFNKFSPVYGDFREKIAPGFFDAALSREDADIRALINHDPNLVLGRTKSGTLQLSSDEIGLKMHNAPPDTTFARDLLVSMERGDYSGASFSFSLPEKGGDQWAKGEDGIMERTLLRAEQLYDVGPVTFPWYPQTDVTVAKRSLDEWEAEHAPAEESAEERGRIIAGNNDTDLRDRLRVAVTAVEPDAEFLYVEAVFDAEVIYEMRMMGGPYALYGRSYEMAEDGEVAVGAERAEVRRRVSYEVVDEAGDDEPMGDDMGDMDRTQPPLALLKVMQEQKEREAAG